MNCKLFCFPEYGCMKSYKTFDKLNQHLLIGNHVFKKLHVTKKKMKLWAAKCDSVLTATRPRHEQESEVSNRVDLLVQEWGLMKEKRYSRFLQK